MPIRQVIQEQGRPVKIWTDEIDTSAKQQLLNLASLPFIHHHVAAMPYELTAWRDGLPTFHRNRPGFKKSPYGC